MQKILSFALLVAAVTLAAGTAQAASHVAKKAHARTALTVSAAPKACDPSTCGHGGSCPHGGGARTMMTVSAIAHPSAVTVGARACPVSDPSACPPGCKRGAAAARADGKVASR